MTGGGVLVQVLCIPFGCYCQISTDGTPSNSMLVRIEGFRSPQVANASVVVRRQRVNLL